VVTEVTLHAVFEELVHQGAVLEGVLLKPSMVLPGKDCAHQVDVQEVAEATLRCLRRTVPAAVPGIVFLSGGQEERQATAHLHAMNVLESAPPWALSFSYARALQATAMRIWRGQPQNVPAAQDALAHRARCNSAAREGRYTAELEQAARELVRADRA
jgi:fructose-bisphosphate aldolase class I